MAETYLEIISTWAAWNLCHLNHRLVIPSVDKRDGDGCSHLCLLYYPHYRVNSYFIQGYSDVRLLLHLPQHPHPHGGLDFDIGQREGNDSSTWYSNDAMHNVFFQNEGLNPEPLHRIDVHSLFINYSKIGRAHV